MPRSAAASRASVVTRPSRRAGAPRPAPPTSRRRKRRSVAPGSSPALPAVMPPVGQKRMSGQRRRQRLQIGTPPAGSAGKNFRIAKPASASVIASPAVATPGRNGTAAVLGGREQTGRRPRAHQELGAARTASSSWRGVEDGARPDIGALDLRRDRADAVAARRACAASLRARSARRRPRRGRAAPQPLRPRWSTPAPPGRP